MSEETMKCPACAEEIPAGSAVCKFCGEKIASNETAAPSDAHSGNGVELYHPNAASLWSLLLTPIFGAFCVMSNWRTLGMEKEAKRSKTWLAVLSVVLGLSFFLFFSGPYCLIAFVALVLWHFMESRKQTQYLTENKIEYSRKSWKSVALKALAILVVAGAIDFALAAIFAEPTIDCSSNQAFKESAEVIVEYLKDEHGIDEDFAKKAEYDDLTKEEKALLRKIAKFQLFVEINQPSGDNATLDKEEVEKIDGMTASEILDYVDENCNGGLFQVFNERLG